MAVAVVTSRKLLAVVVDRRPTVNGSNTDERRRYERENCNSKRRFWCGTSAAGGGGRQKPRALSSTTLSRESGPQMIPVPLHLTHPPQPLLVQRRAPPPLSRCHKGNLPFLRTLCTRARTVTGVPAAAVLPAGISEFVRVWYCVRWATVRL